jgi:hypothetical protein
MQVAVEPRCSFKHPAFQQLGRWYGGCDNGVATGKGYGLIMNKRGDSLEYIGDARKGLAAGTGGMIISKNGQIGATYYEGSFKNGLPDGVVRVEKAGQQARLRQFNKGVDVGKGSASKLQSLEFVSTHVNSEPLSP